MVRIPLRPNRFVRLQRTRCISVNTRDGREKLADIRVTWGFYQRMTIVWSLWEWVYGRSEGGLSLETGFFLWLLYFNVLVSLRREKDIICFLRHIFIQFMYLGNQRIVPHLLHPQSYKDFCVGLQLVAEPSYTRWSWVFFLLSNLHTSISDNPLSNRCFLKRQIPLRMSAKRGHFDVEDQGSNLQCFNIFFKFYKPFFLMIRTITRNKKKQL